VDATKFARAFWSDVTPFETGVRATALSFRAGTMSPSGKQSGAASPMLLS
jgi:hypothetical protein